MFIDGLSIDVPSNSHILNQKLNVSAYGQQHCMIPLTFYSEGRSSYHMLSVLITKRQRLEETLRGDGYTCYLDCGDGLTACAYVQTHPTVYIKDVHFSCTYDTSTKLFKNK